MRNEFVHPDLIWDPLPCFPSPPEFFGSNRDHAFKTPVEKSNVALRRLLWVGLISGYNMRFPDLRPRKGLEAKAGLTPVPARRDSRPKDPKIKKRRIGEMEDLRFSQS